MVDTEYPRSARLGSVSIVEVPITDPNLLRLVGIHHEYCVAQTPKSSGHALRPSSSALKGIRFFAALEHDVAIGCIGLTLIAPGHGEIKTMHVLTEARGKRIGSALLSFALQEARKMGCSRVSLETGKSDGFAASVRFYQGHGFLPCPPYGAYVDDPFSLCMTRPC